ncbi:hypothetical protein [Pseudomonas huaxiensis]|uniref:hypothetical protein n=1 Tax=Pseudomonas huaxiensis TaxID=2213017 RepID=UPI000DA6ADD7|nr:hypothetical protein [Pseudomonas huaxiensis]
MLNHEANDILPSMVGFEGDSVGAGEHCWRSPGFLLADRDLGAGERIHAWIIRESDGRIMKTVTFTASKDNAALSKWPAAFLAAINAAPVASDEPRYLSAGKLSDNGGLEVSADGSPSSETFSKMSAAEKTAVNRLWYYEGGYRLFTSAPFIANQVIAAPMPKHDLTADESIAVQVRDRTSLTLYESFVFTPENENSRKAIIWHEALCKQIAEINKEPTSTYGMLRAGKLDEDKVSVATAKADNALWIPQFSNLSVEVEPVTWQKYRTVTKFKPTVEAVIQCVVYDRYSGAQLPGSPFSYTVNNDDFATCMASLADELKDSPLSSYVRLAGATVDAKPSDSQNLWIMGLPVRVVTLGLPGVDAVHEKALETLEGVPLTLGELFDTYKNGIRITLCDRWSGRVVHAWTFEPSDADKAARDVWVRSLCASLGSKFATDAPFVGFGEKSAQFVAPAVTDKHVEVWTLWLPPEAEMVVHVESWTSKVKKKEEKFSPVGTELNFLRDRLAIEELLSITATKGLMGNHEKIYYDDEDYFSKFLMWRTNNEFVFIRFRPIKEVSDWMGSDTKRSELFGLIELNALPDDIYAKDVIRTAVGKAGASALAASRVARKDGFYAEEKLWQLRLPSTCRINECLACTESNVILSVTDCGGVSSKLLEILHSLYMLMLECGGYDFARKKSSVLVIMRALEKLIVDGVPGALKLFEAFNNAAGAEILTREYLVTLIDEWLSNETPLTDDLKSKLKQELGGALGNGKWPSVTEMLGLLETKATPESLKVFGMLKPFEVFESVCSGSVLANILSVSSLPTFTLNVQLLSGITESGVRFISNTSEQYAAQRVVSVPMTRKEHIYFSPFSGRYQQHGGIHLHIPNGMNITPNFPLARASYVSESGITSAAASALTINPPITGWVFVPRDSLCADYANTLGSEVYDISGATENGVDPRTGLFHAHYPVGTIRGLNGEGPEVDLTLHYSATRANESALGDGWAFRFSSYDNRLHRLMLSTGQTLTLTSEHIQGALGENYLPINGVTLTAAEGSFDELTSLSVIFPSGRKEVLGKPSKHDGEEASEHYKTAYVKKLETVQSNLEQWLRESGLTSEDRKKLTTNLDSIKKQKEEASRKALILVPGSISSPQGGSLTLKWEGKKGHVLLRSICDGKVDLLTAKHSLPVASGKYASKFTVWPGTVEEYSVKLEITDCLLTTLKRQGKSDDLPTQTVVFGYCDDPVLDRVLNSVAEEDGSLEAVSYLTNWKTWNPRVSPMPLPRVERHTLVPGAGQSVISHTWQWSGVNNALEKEGDSFSSTQTLDLGDGVGGSYTRRTWTLKNGYSVQTEIVEGVPGASRRTTRMEYPNTVSGSTLTAQYRWATQPIKTTVTTEDLRPTPATPAAQEKVS